MKFGCSNCFFLNTTNLMCRSTDISKCFRGSLRFRDNESRLYVHVNGLKQYGHINGSCPFCFLFIFLLQFKKWKWLEMDVAAAFNGDGRCLRVWGGNFCSVCSVCLAWRYVSLWVRFFPFWFWGWNVRSDCICSWPLPLFLLYYARNYM